MTHQNVIPYICVRGAAEAIEFYKQAFGAKELYRQAGANGKIRHAEIEVGDSKIMVHDEFPEFPDMKSLQSAGGSPVNLFVYLDGIDAAAARATAAGAQVKTPVQDQPYGRSGGFVDPYGLVWWLCTPPE